MKYEPKIITVSCPGCGSIKAETVTITRDFELANDSGAFAVVTCQNCSLSYTSPRPQFDVLFSRHYPIDYICYGKQGSAGATALDRMRRNKQAEKRAEILAGLLGGKGKKRILEVGCATGEFLEVCRDQYGYEVVGIEPNTQLAEILSRKGIEVQAMPLEHAILNVNYYDAVCFFNVLEHLWDPLASLYLLNHAVNSNGILFIEIPCFDATGRSFFGKYWFLYHLPRHLTHFSRSTLKTVAAQAGFGTEVLYKPAFRPTVNALSFKYALAESVGGWISRLFSESNPFMLAAGVFAEFIWFVVGTPGTMTNAFRKTVEVDMSTKGYLQKFEKVFMDGDE